VAIAEVQEAGKSSVVVRFTEKIINATNAQSVTEELKAIIAEYPHLTLVMNFENVEFISSAGLRALLIAEGEAQKECDQKISIFDVAPFVMKTFEETGLTQIFHVYEKMQEYSLDGVEQIGRGTNGVIYRIDKENLIKVFQKSTPLESIQRERELAKQALIAGIPTAISYNVAHVGDQYGIVFEMLQAQPLSAVLKTSPDQYDLYVEKYIALLQMIHQTKGDKSAFGSIKEIYAEAIEECKQYYTDEEIGLLRELVGSVPDSDTLIHGDYHPNNIMVEDGSLILIDMGDMSCGHPVFDFLATAATQVNLVKLNPDYAQMHTNMPVQLITKTWRRLIDGYFSKYDEQERARIEEQICLFSKLKVALCPFFGRGVSQEILNASIEDARENLLPKIKDLIGAMDW
jgi:uncharacterized protein (TIGR02172 family)